MATVGHDFAPYRQWLRDRSVDVSQVRVVDDEFTAQAFITTDLDDNQITAFHPGAMSHSHVNHVRPGAGHARSGSLPRTAGTAWSQHAAQFAAAGIPMLFDPGQGLPMFDGEDLLEFVSQATWIAVNDYEGQLLCERTGLSHREIASRVQALIVTRGAEGSVIHAGGREHMIPAARPRGRGRSHRLR